MTPILAVGLMLALASAIALDVAFLMQQRAAARLPTLRLRAPLRSARSLIGARLWLAGFVLGLGGWGLYLAALATAPLSLVQTVAAGGIGLLVVLAAAWQRVMPSARERLGAAIATAGLAALALSIPGSGAGAGVPGGASVSLVVLSVTLVALAVRCARRSSAGWIGLAAGIFYGLGDVWTKVVLNAVPVHPGVLDVIAQPALPAVIVAHVCGFLALQRAFQRGGPVASIAPMTAATNLVPMLAGPLVLGEALPASPLLLALRITAFVAAGAGATLLARARAHDGSGSPAPGAEAALPAAVPHGGVRPTAAAAEVVSPQA
jgi:hypothetical protein